MESAFEIPKIECLIKWQFDMFCLNLSYAKFDSGDAQIIDENITSVINNLINSFQNRLKGSPKPEAFFEVEMQDIMTSRRENGGTGFFCFDKNRVSLLEYYEMGWEKAISGGESFDECDFSIHLLGRATKFFIDEQCKNIKQRQSIYRRLQPHAIEEYALGIVHAWYHGWLEKNFKLWKEGNKEKVLSSKNHILIIESGETADIPDDVLNIDDDEIGFAISDFRKAAVTSITHLRQQFEKGPSGFTEDAWKMATILFDNVDKQCRRLKRMAPKLEDEFRQKIDASDWIDIFETTDLGTIMQMTEQEFTNKIQSFLHKEIKQLNGENSTDQLSNKQSISNDGNHFCKGMPINEVRAH